MKDCKQSKQVFGRQDVLLVGTDPCPQRLSRSDKKHTCDDRSAAGFRHNMEAEQREKSGAVGDTANGTKGATVVDMDRSVQMRTKSRSKRLSKLLQGSMFEYPLGLSKLLQGSMQDVLRAYEEITL
ncbi:hypothetical protein LSAT2_022934 [Lamellibrachia satsuma]|nr:hypothetical protein LSAT2_022934 [Lamellibrachia satsuma]